MKQVNILNAILSHLSDAQDWMNYSPEKAREEINMVKAIILYMADDKLNYNVNTEDLDNLYNNIVKKLK